MGAVQTARRATEAGITVSFTILIVLYETAPQNAQTIIALQTCKELGLCRRIVCIDHSRLSQAEAFHAIRFGGSPGCPEAIYRHDPTNPPLGIAYNRAISECLGDSTYLVVLDQDTRLPVDFLVVCRSVAQAEAEPTALLPSLVCAGRIASPCWSFLGWGRSWARARAGWHDWRWCSAIMSASVIHRRAFAQWGLSYSEQLPFYGIDTDFFHRLGRKDPAFYILPLSMEHSLSFDEAALPAKSAKLDQIFAANRIIFANSWWGALGIVRLLETLLRLKYALRYRSTMFLARPGKTPGG